MREIIGPRGKVIRGITDSTGCKINIHDDGTVNIFPPTATPAGAPCR